MLERGEIKQQIIFEGCESLIALKLSDKET